MIPFRSLRFSSFCYHKSVQLCFSKSATKRSSTGKKFASTLEIHHGAGQQKASHRMGFEEETAAVKDSRLMQLGNFGDLTMVLGDENSSKKNS